MTWVGEMSGSASRGMLITASVPPTINTRTAITTSKRFSIHQRMIALIMGFAPLTPVHPGHGARTG